jgi:pimeloyl-ACP methyl ester carboxylesterase
VVVFVWYPSERRSGAEKSGYVPHLEAIAAVIGDSAMNAEFGSARSAISSGAVRSYAAENAPVKRTGRPFPVVVFSHGFGESSLMYSAQLEDLASHGYVVFGIEHPSDAFATALTPNHVVAFARAAWDSARTRPNGAVAYQLAQVPLRAADVRFVLDRIWRLGTLPGGAGFADALDLHRVGAFGHSLGGMAVANACRFDARIRACMNQDADDEGRPFDGGQTAFRIKQPFLFFATGHSIYASPRTRPPTDSALSGMKLSRAQYDSITGFYQHNQDRALAAMPGGSVRVKAEAEDFTHRTFMDLKLLQAPDTVAARRQTEYLQLIRRYVRAFFDGTLRGQPAPLLARDGAVDSLVTVEHWQR